MLFSEYFKIEKSVDDDWFDPVLEADVELFLDPFLIYGSSISLFSGAKKKTISFFEDVFSLVQSQKINGKIDKSLAINALLFPEAEEFCIGFTQFGSKGSGTGKKFANLMHSAIEEFLSLGIDFSYVENFTFFVDDIGIDRISDITANILKKEFIEYTQEICKRHNIKIFAAPVKHYQYDSEKHRWNDLPLTYLPLNPYSNKPIVLIPKQFLRSSHQKLTLSQVDFWDYLRTVEGEYLRKEFGREMLGSMTKENIRTIVHRAPGVLADYNTNAKNKKSYPYDLVRDVDLLYINKIDAAKIAREIPDVKGVNSIEEFSKIVEIFCQHFKHSVEKTDGWEFLWDEEEHIPERKITKFFRQIVSAYCKIYNVDISTESDTGQGLLDVKLSSGFHFKSILEIKLVSNKKFWSGLEKQLPTYLAAEQTNLGYFIAIVFTDDEFGHINTIKENLKLPSTNKVNFLVVDARKKKSASRL